MKLGKVFFNSLQELYLFSRKSKFIILDIQISWRYQMPKHKIRNTYLNTYSLLMKFEQFMSYYKRKNLLKRHTKTATWKLVPDPLVPGPLLENEFLKQATYIKMSNSKTIKICSNQHAALLRFLFTEDSLISIIIFLS